MRLVLLGIAISIQMTMLTPAQAANCGMLFAVRGSVEILRNQAKSADASENSRYYFAGKNFAPLFCDDVVVTRDEASAIVQISRGKIAIGPNSRLEIASYGGSVKEPEVQMINLIYGRIRTLIIKKPEQASSEAVNFRVHTRTATVGVRGTDFFVSHDPYHDITRQATVQGHVEVTRIESVEAPVSVGPSQQVFVEGELDSKSASKLQVVGLTEVLKREVRSTSVIAKNDADFTKPEAVQVLGPPKDWHEEKLEKYEKEEVPSKYKDLKNEY